MYRDHWISYYTKVLYHPISPFGLMTCKIGILHRNWQGIKKPCSKNLSMRDCFQLYGILSLVRTDGFWPKANSYKVGFKAPHGISLSRIEGFKACRIWLRIRPCSDG